MSRDFFSAGVSGHEDSAMGMRKKPQSLRKKIAAGLVWKKKRKQQGYGLRIRFGKSSMLRHVHVHGDPIQDFGQPMLS